MRADDLLRSLEEEAGELLERRTKADDRDYTVYANDPVRFIQDILHSKPWDRQVEIAEAVRDHAQVTVRSCHAAGKDWLAARLALWWVYARQGLVILTGPTAAQIEEILMRGEVWSAFHAARLPGELHVRALRPVDGGLAGILARTGAGVSSMTGFHRARVLYVITEAQDPDIEHAWDAGFACTTGEDDRLLTVGNPTEVGGKFEAAHRRGSGWHAVKITAADSPNVQAGKTVIPGLLTRQGVSRFEREYGAESSYCLSRVHAEFPTEAEDALVQREWLDRSHDLWKRYTLLNGGPLVLGCDPARLGPDASALCVRQGAHVREFVQWRNHDTMQTADRVMVEVRRLFGDVGQVDSVWVDQIGLGGGVLDRLGELLPRITHEAIPQPIALAGQARPYRYAPSAMGFDAGKRPGHESKKRKTKNTVADRFVNNRALAYWHVRKLLEDGKLALPPIAELDEELLATRVRFNPDGRTQIEAKDDIRKRLGRSPDLADALVISFAPDLDDGRMRVIVG
jgi:phage terminase large subunit